MGEAPRQVAVLQELMERTAPVTGEAFLRVLTRGLAELIDVDHAFIAFAVDNPPSRVRVEASWFKGADRESWEYDLEGQPCRLPYNGEPTFIPCDVGQRFDKKRDSGYESFIGIPLRDDAGQVVGHLSVYGARPLDPDGEELYLAGLFAQRAEAEARRAALEIQLRETVADLERANKRLHEESTTDALTGLINRRAFADVADREVRRARRNGRDVGLVFMDLDHFKAVNDQHGHAAGDRVLVEAAVALRSAVRGEVDTAARIGGEEFVVLMPEASASVMARVAGQILAAVRDLTVQVEGAVVRPTCSVGHSVLTDGDRSWEDLLARADGALYQAKEQGRDCAVCA